MDEKKVIGFHNKKRWLDFLKDSLFILTNLWVVGDVILFIYSINRGSGIQKKKKIFLLTGIFVVLLLVVFWLVLDLNSFLFSILYLFIFGLILFSKNRKNDLVSFGPMMVLLSSIFYKVGYSGYVGISLLLFFSISSLILAVIMIIRDLRVKNFKFLILFVVLISFDPIFGFFDNIIELFSVFTITRSYLHFLVVVLTIVLLPRVLKLKADILYYYFSIPLIYMSASPLGLSTLSFSGLKSIFSERDYWVYLAFFIFLCSIYVLIPLFHYLMKDKRKYVFMSLVGIGGLFVGMMGYGSFSTFIEYQLSSFIFISLFLIYIAVFYNDELLFQQDEI